MPLYYQNPTPVQSAIFTPSGSPDFNGAYPGAGMSWVTAYDNIGITNNTTYITLPIGKYQAVGTLNFTGTGLAGAQIYLGIQVSASLQFLQAHDIQNNVGGTLSFTHSFIIEAAGNFAISGYRGNAAVTAAATLSAVRSSITIVKLA